MDARAEIIDAVFILSILALVLVGHPKRTQLVCAVNESDYLWEGYIQVQESERHAFARQHAQGHLTMKAIPNAVACTWNGNDTPTYGALWNWKPKTRVRSNG